jgi:hypothetical protein
MSYYTTVKAFERRLIVGSRLKWERNRAQRRMTVGRAIMGKKACRRKATTDKKHSTRACKKEATAGRKKQTHAKKEDLTKVGLGFL